ncbi:MAG: arginyltransferase [Desulfobulbales bacterium]|nr:arginyltransferase [Desulfobulbales bacterium]
MTDHRQAISLKAERIKEELQQYFMHSSMACPYGLPFLAVYNQALFDTMPDFVMQAYLEAGYRRNGNIIYNMHCPECNACVPVRLKPQEFKPNRNQKRVWNRNRDISVETAPLACSEENLALLEKFLATRYPGRDSTALEYYNNFFLNHITDSVEFRYRIGSELVGVAIVDLSPLWLNVVFYYFDPEQGKRSPGTYNILYLIEFCKEHNIPFIYIGYWIDGVKAMSYKALFKPHYQYRDDRWHQVSR